MIALAYNTSFAGLHKDKRGRTQITGHASLEHWFYAVGVILDQYQAIPGPRENMTKEVQLWAKKDY